jgi:hypothetical protein
VSARGIFEGRCSLCGAPTRAVYCWAHDWANEKTAPRYWIPPTLPADTNELWQALEVGRAQGLAAHLYQIPEPEPPFTLTKLHEWWLERHSPPELIELAGHLEAIPA